MKYLNEFRNADILSGLADKIAAAVSRPWTIMEVCGGQTHSIVKYGLEQLLPAGVELVHGPGCPVCVTAADTIDRAIAISRRRDVIFCSYGDMLRVPGSQHSLNDAKANGADIRILYSPLDAVAIARQHPDRKVVFFAVGFETTAPATAMALAQARGEGIRNFYVLMSHFLVPPAIHTLMQGGSSRVQGFLAPGHVCAVTGTAAYKQLSRQYQVPIVISGFEPADIMLGILSCVEQLERGEAQVDNQYQRVVATSGNRHAMELVETVFQQSDQAWRGIGTLATSGLGLSDDYRVFDANALLDSAPETPEQAGQASAETIASTGCISGKILQGIRKPSDCPQFGTRCRPEHPLGAPMVSSEGACAAYFHYR